MMIRNTCEGVRKCCEMVWLGREGGREGGGEREGGREEVGKCLLFCVCDFEIRIDFANS